MQLALKFRRCEGRIVFFNAIFVIPIRTSPLLKEVAGLAQFEAAGLGCEFEFDQFLFEFGNEADAHVGFAGKVLDVPALVRVRQEHAEYSCTSRPEYRFEFTLNWIRPRLAINANKDWPKIDQRVSGEVVIAYAFAGQQSSAAVADVRRDDNRIRRWVFRKHVSELVGGLSQVSRLTLSLTFDNECYRLLLELRSAKPRQRG